MAAPTVVYDKSGFKTILDSTSKIVKFDDFNAIEISANTARTFEVNGSDYQVPVGKAALVVSADNFYTSNDDVQFSIVYADDANGLTNQVFIARNNAQDVALSGVFSTVVPAGKYINVANNTTLANVNDVRTQEAESTNLQTLDVSGQVAGYLSYFSYNNDGTKLYAQDQTNDTIYQYDMSTAYDFSTASYASKSFDYSGTVNNSYSSNWCDSGNRYFILKYTSPHAYFFNASTAYDISTLSVDTGNNKSLTGDTYGNYGWMNEAGTRFIWYGYDGRDFNQWDLSTAYDLTTASQTAVVSSGIATGSLKWSPNINAMNYWYNDNNTSLIARQNINASNFDANTYVYADGTNTAVSSMSGNTRAGIKVQGGYLAFGDATSGAGAIQKIPLGAAQCTTQNVQVIEYTP